MVLHPHSSDIHTNRLPSAVTVEMAEMPETVVGPLFIANCMDSKCISKSRSISIFSNADNMECIYRQDERAKKSTRPRSNFMNIIYKSTQKVPTFNGLVWSLALVKFRT